MLTVERSEKHEPGEVTIPDRLRPINEDRVAEIMVSFEKMGQISPIQVHVTKGGEDVILVAGRHRLEAARRLGWQWIEINVVYGSDDDFRLWEIAENLHRAELTVLERAEHLTEWIRLYQKHGAERLQDVRAAVSQAEKMPVSQITAGSQLASKGGRGSTTRVGKSAHPQKSGGLQPHDVGVSAAAQEFHVDRKDVRRAREVASIASEAKQAARDAGLDKNQSALLKVAAAPKEEQVAAVERIRAQKAERRQPLLQAVDLPSTEGHDDAPDLSSAFTDYVIAHIAEDDIPGLLGFVERMTSAQMVVALKSIVKAA